MIHVCNLDLIDKSIKDFGAQYLVSLINKDMMPETPSSIDADKHLKLAFNDIDQPANGLVNMQNKDMDQLLEFLAKWDQQAPILFHCWAGVSRSTAGAYVAANFVKGAGSEDQIANLLRFYAPFATPNKLVVRLADQALNRDGAMIKAINDIGRGEYCHSGTPFTLEL